MTGGFFVTVDGPSGVGKSTTIAELQRLLASQGRGCPAGSASLR